MASIKRNAATVVVVDHLGVDNEAEARYVRAAKLEIEKLEEQLDRGKLAIGTRSHSIGDNVFVDCTICNQLVQAVVTVGKDVEERVEERPCYCCSPGFVAGVILEVYAPSSDDLPEYSEDDHYYADVVLCQAPPALKLVRTTVYEVRKSGGRLSQKIVSTGSGAGGRIQIRAIFSDYEEHQPGDTVLVLIQPGYSFAPADLITPLVGVAPYGEMMPSLNEGLIGGTEYPQVKASTEYPASTGLACQMMLEMNMWDEAEGGDEKYNPFRILPIKVESCL